MPGIVNAHSHLEYAVYAGFGDGLSFAPWLATHIERKARIDRPEMEAIARLGAAQCLASGITTVGDAAFTGASAHACSELGLRAIVYLEVFGRDPSEAMKQFEEKTEYVASALIRRLAAAGLLDPRIVAAHCVKVDAEEIGMLARHDVAVVHCPRSNGLLGCGVAPLAELRTAGLRIGIGTDGISSVPSHDAFEELRAAISAARARSERADALSPTEALELATLGGAQALGLEAEVGSLVPGKRADLAILTLAASPYLPWEDPAAAVVYGGSPERVLATLVDGEARYERGGFEWHELIDAASAARSRMLAPAPAGVTPPAATATWQP